MDWPHPLTVSALSTTENPHGFKPARVPIFVALAPSSPSRQTDSPQPPPPDRPGRHQDLAIALLPGAAFTSAGAHYSICCAIDIETIVVKSLNEHLIAQREKPTHQLRRRFGRVRAWQKLRKIAPYVLG